MKAAQVRTKADARQIILERNLSHIKVGFFDIDGVIRDVAGSYRRALQETVRYYSGWCPTPEDIDKLKGEGRWNNDWDASLELLRRHGTDLPDRNALIDVFSGLYFGGDPQGDPSDWTGRLSSNHPSQKYFGTN